MRIAILGDCHIGMRGDSIHFHEYYRKFYENVFIPYLKQHDITTVIQTGDLFDRRKFLSYNTLYLAKQYLFNPLRDAGIKMVVYLGNHDVYYRNTLEVNSVELVLKEYIENGNVVCIKEPTTVELDGTVIDLIPWICADNKEKIWKFIENSRSSICFGHFEIEGFEMDAGNVCKEGTLREDLTKYETVITGHFHHRSTDGHIFYVGSPGEITWADYGDKRGFHIFDTSTRELEFIENPYKMFHKISYDEDIHTLSSISKYDFSKYSSTIIKVIVNKRTNQILFDHFMEELYRAGPLEVNIVEDFIDYNTISDDDIIDQADDTTTLISKYIDSMEVSVDRDRLKTIMRDIYMEAQNLEDK